MTDSLPRCAVTTTLTLPRSAGSVLDSFVSFHLAAGFDRVFLYFDGADDDAVHDVHGWLVHARASYPKDRVVCVPAGPRRALRRAPAARACRWRASCETPSSMNRASPAGRRSSPRTPSKSTEPVTA